MIVDRRIINGCKSGKRKAQNMLYQAYAGVMLGVCLRFSRSREEAEDILQEGFIKVFTNIRNLKEDAAITSWIRTIMVNTAITYSKKSRIFFEELDDDRIPDAMEEEDPYMPMDPQLLIRIIQGMPDGYRMVLNLHVFEGYNHKEIADNLGISESTSKTQLFKARKYIKRALIEPDLLNKNIVGDERRI